MLSQYEASGVKMADFSPFMWGKPALEHYQSKQKLGWLLWKQPSMQEVLSCFRRDKMFQSVTLFPLDKSLEACVHTVCVVQVYIRMYMCVHAHVHACVRATVLVAHTVKCTKLMEK